MYSVTWTLDVEDRTTPEQAALQAYFTMQRCETSVHGELADSGRVL